MVIRIRRNERLRADVVSELFKYLRYRYELSERALAHHAKLAADVMIGKVMEMWKAALETEMSADEATARIEQQVLRRGDDGLLEHLLDRAEQHSADDRWQGVAEIAARLQRRQLFKVIGVYTNRAMAGKLHARFKDPEARAQVERDAADQAGVDRGWMVALWVPNPEMRFKPAQVLVDDGSGIEIVPLEAWDSENGKRGSEIFESHHGLWAMRVYVDRQTSKEQREMVLDRLREQLGISEWDGRQRAPAQSTVVQDSGGVQLPIAVAAERVDGQAVPVDHGQTPESSVQSSRDGGASDAMRWLIEWRTSRRISIEHPNLEEAISAARDSVVQLGDKRFNLQEPEDLIRLNLTYFLDDLSNGVFETPAGREQVAEFIREAPVDFENRVLDELPVSHAARRPNEAMGETNPAALAFETAVRNFLNSEGSGRLRFDD